MKKTRGQKSCATVPLMRKNEIKRKQNEKEAKTSKWKRMKRNSGTICKESKKSIKLVFYFFMTIPSMVKRSEKTFISFHFEAKQSKKTFISFCFEAKRKDQKQSENTLYLRDSSTRFSTSAFFHQTNIPGPLIYILKYFRIRYWIRRDIRIQSLTDRNII